MNATELVLRNPQPDTMLTVIERAVMSPDFDVNKLKELFAVRERYEAAEAKKAFTVAKARFKTLPITITKDKTNTQYDSKYTSIGNLVNTVTPFLSQCGLEANWNIDQTSGIKVTCVLTHEHGHEQAVSITFPPDKSGSKNDLQQIKAAITYGRIITFECVCGLASSDPNINVDDDGNSASTNGALSEKVEWLLNAKDVTELDKLFRNSYQEFKGNRAAQTALIDAKDRRRRELR